MAQESVQSLMEAFAQETPAAEPAEPSAPTAEPETLQSEDNSEPSGETQDGQLNLLDGEGEGAEEPAEQTVDPAKEKRKFKYKYNGEEFEEELTEDEIAYRVSKYRGAEEKFREAAEDRKEMQKVKVELDKKYDAVMKAKEDPIGYLKELGLDFDKLSTEHVTKLFELESMTPEQKEAYEAKKELAELKKKNAENQKTREQAEADAQVAKEIDQYNKRTISILDAFNLPKDRNTALRVIDEFKNDFYYETQAKQKGEYFQPRSDEEIAKAVRDNYSNEMTGYIGSLDGEDLLNTLGKDTVSKVIDAYMKGREKPKVTIGDKPVRKKKEKKIVGSLDEAFSED